MGSAEDASSEEAAMRAISGVGAPPKLSAALPGEPLGLAENRKPPPQQPQKQPLSYQALSGRADHSKEQS